MKSYDACRSRSGRDFGGRKIMRTCGARTFKASLSSRVVHA
jgi:hypothetical protein